MFWLVALALLLLSARIARVYRENILDSITVSYAGLLMLLYLLAFFNGLKAVGAVSVLVVVYVFVRMAMDARADKNSFAKELTEYGRILADPGVILAVICSAVVGVLTRQQVFTWWDDINFWSSDAKQIFFLNGFSGKYGNVSPEFGDYPPITSLAKWLFLQIGSGEYNESLQFLGYFVLCLIFLFPMLAKVMAAIKAYDINRWCKMVLMVLAFVCTALFPGVFNGIIYYGTPADITMAIVYGALLLTIYDSYGHEKTLYYVRIGLYTAILLLTKSVGFEWALFALVFYVVVANREKLIWLPVLFAGASYGSWLLFCFANRRVAKLTGAGIRMATSGTYTAPDNTIDKMRYFVEGFMFQPMHSDYNPTVDLSTGAAVLLIFGAMTGMYFLCVLGKSEFKKIALFSLITGALAYAIVFMAHISLFQTEDQYLDAYAMGISIARYCAPFTMGSMYLLIGIGFNRLRASNVKRRMLIFGSVCALVVLLCAEYSGVYKYLRGYRDQLAENKAYVSDMVGEDGKELVLAVSDKEYWGKRVLVFRDGHEYYWVHNTYISKEASPTALVYDTFLIEEDTADTIRQKMLDSHASYFYVEDKDGVAKELFSDVVTDGEYEPGVVLKIEGAGN